MTGENKRAELINEMLKAARDASPEGAPNASPKGTPNASPQATPDDSPETAPIPAPIAIIGLSGYFPQSRNVHEFWDALDKDKTLLEEIPSSRIDWKSVYDPDGKDIDGSHSIWGGVIPDVRHFDPGFFGILPSEASLMDPRKRLLLMSVYHALEDAGYAPRSFDKGRTGVFVAVEEDEYRQCLQASGIDMRSGTAPSSSLIANEISYFFDFRGPSEVINTMCSGAAVAIHRAVNALRSGEISDAVVGAANIMLSADPFVFLSETGQMSPTHSVKSFGKDANGFLRADGVAVMILKPLSKAVEDKDDIYAVIKNTAVNYNGKGGMSIAAPNISSHADLIRSCYEGADINPQRVSYIEAQGMGNPVADIAEWEACNRALKAIAKNKKVELANGGCRISTLKPMTGHMHAASALGALFKIIRSFQTNKVHKILDFGEINPDLDMEEQPCRLVVETEHWPEEHFPRLAGLHSYGSGGNNAHILVEEYKGQPAETDKGSLANAYKGPQGKETSSDPEKVIISCSAVTEEQCKIIVKDLLAFVTRYPDLSLSSIAYTMQVGRDAMKHRVDLFAATREEFIDQANAYLEGRLPEHTTPSKTTTFKEPVRRLHLPVYPFACQEYWIAGNDRISLPDDKHEIDLQPLAQTEEIIRNTLSYFLQRSPESIDLKEEFSSMGFDSLLVTNLTRRLEQQYGLKLETAIFFEHTTPEQLILFISGQFKDRLTNKNDRREAPVNGEKEPIAIIGLAGSFPKSPDIELFWGNIAAGNYCVEEVPGERWPVSEHFHPDMEIADKAGKSYGKWGGFIKDLYSFDPLFFNISPSEAAMMNPKERLFLQCAWHVMEDAGYTPQSLLPEQVGVFAGVTRSGLDPYKVSMFPVANRVSYVFNFRGPSMPIDTACSSSLVAVHEACQHIHAGECTVAIAGGVHAFLDPSHFAALSALHMLSPEGVSRSFGDQANGMVPGEGVGAVLLKPLKRAIADRDHIYGIIRGSSTNHGGKANGFTVPNPRSHAALIQNALKKANVNAREINYVEAHGTGTSLGDPIEIRGLTEAFRKDTADTQYCSIGSIKSNIGHLEAAAGISGLAKILLQMKYRKLAPSLHSKRLNPQIDFSKTPFYVQQEMVDWAPVDKDGNEIPRVACVSSFGAGGANAHVIIKEYPQALIPQPEKGSTESPAIILLSARSTGQLNEQGKRLLSFLEGLDDYKGLLHDIAYTLQTGREAMDERMVTEVVSLDELKDKLKLFIAGATNIDKLYTGNSKRNKETVALLSDDKEMGRIAEEWAMAQNYGKLISLWAKGFNFKWDQLFYKQQVDGRLPQRISLPGYPFLKEYFGPPAVGKGSQQSVLPVGSLIHPLVHRNSSTFSEQRFSSTFNGEEFFLKDHIVNGRKVLPGVAYLEMIHAALNLAADNGTAGENDVAIRLNNVTWIQPVIVEDRPHTLNISLLPEGNEAVSFEIYSGSGDKEPGSTMVHSQGTARFVKSGKPLFLDIGAIKEATGKTSFSADQCYHVFEKMGISYGPSHRAIEYLFAGEEEALAKLSIPPAIAGTLDSFYIHPALMDAAFQAIMGFMALGRNEIDGLLPLAVPFALKELIVLGKCTSGMWAHIRYSEGNALQDRLNDINNLSFDIDLCDESGKLCVQVRGFISRVLVKEIRIPRAEGLLFLQPSWEEGVIDTTAEKVRYEEHVVLYADGLIPAGAEMDGLHFIPLPVDEADKGERITNYAVRVLKEIQQLLRARLKGKILVQALLTTGPDHEMLTAVAGLLKTAHMENPQFSGQVILIGHGESFAEIALKLEQNSRQPEEQQIRYSNGQRIVSWLREFIPVNDTGHPWKENGVYLITGGAGGLGLLFAREITLRTKNATLVLTGRSVLNEERIKQIESIQVPGVRVEYRQVDVADEIAVATLVKNILQDHDRLDVMIHCAGVHQDNFILKKTEEEMRAVLAPKVQGLINLDLATKDLPLDYFIVFSSVAGVMGNTGQADYAVANAVMDEYAGYRNSLIAAGERKGRTVSINWPLWKEGGMHVGEEIEKVMRDTIGMFPLETAAGIRAFYEIMATGREQMMVVEGDLPLLRKRFLEDPHGKRSVQIPETSTGIEGIGEKAVLYFKKLLSGVIKLSIDRIDADAPLEQYGIDSVMVIQMTNELEKVFGSLQKTLFFEYQSIAELTQYFIGAHAEKLNALLYAGHKKETETVRKDENAPVSVQSRERYRLGPLTNLPREKRGEENSLDIAIIGLSGRYPQARNLQEFWDNLRNGRDSVTEIPRDRWDYRLYFDEDKNKPGKTYTKWGGFLDGVDEFDPLFFNISPKEAGVLDPQERLFLQCAYEVMEDAGYTRETIDRHNAAGPGGNVGVYVGVMWEEYQLYAAQETALGRPMVLSSSPSSIANRVSYYFNFHGPSIAVDTMCSSSLTSIHLACQSLRLGECEAAIAGGVNVSIHPNKYLVLGYGKYASSKGLCESFGVGGDGYVAGEGVGAVLLKPLSRAIADNDHIYGVIKGTAVNHGGKANGFTVPNPRAQAGVIERALKMSGFDARTISYLEAHGTGTSLGDPIEFAGLCKAFNTGEKKFCALGSAKSNIGHCESAAGIAGVTKVLLQMKHRQLVPSLHSATLNPNIDFENSPFVVQQELAEWRRPVSGPDGKTSEISRRAGVSSFGAGGANAHVVIEEYIREEPHKSNREVSGNPVAIILSAKSEDRLKAVATQLLTTIQHRSYEDKDLVNIAYTLQVGRDGMEDRLAMEVTTVKELEEKLACFIRGEKWIENLYVGKVKVYKDILSFFTSDEDIEKTVESWLKKKKFTKLLGLWVNGFDLDWEKLYADPALSYGPPQRISLPAYPFIRDRYWPETGKGKPASDAPSRAVSVMHPLVHQNTSTFAEQRFSSTFTGEEFFLRDHLVNGEKLLPGVAYVEMINEAMTTASGQKRPCIQLENMVWAQPLMVNGHPEKVDIGLVPRDNGGVDFMIYSRSEGDEGKQVTYSQGIARYMEKVEYPVLDIAALKKQAGPNILHAAECYALFSRVGIEYGPAQRGIESLYIGEGQVLAKLSIPHIVADSLDQYYLHPSLMDAALQAVIGLRMKQYTDLKDIDIPLAVPFAIRSLTVLGPCTSGMWALIRYSAGQETAGKGQDISFDIDLCDESGKLCTQIQGYTTRMIGKEGRISKRQGILMMEPYWKHKKIILPRIPVHYVQHLVVVIENDELAGSISGQLAGAKVVPLNTFYSSIVIGFENYAMQMFREVKQLLGSKLQNKVLVQVVMPSQGEKQVFSAIEGLLKTAQFENPLFKGQVIAIEQGETAANVITWLKDNSQDRSDTVIRYRGGEREVTGLREYVPGNEQTEHIWKDGGVYWITGGAGGLGLILVKEIAARVKNATVILTGRSVLNEERERQLDEIRSMGVNVQYRQADITDGEAVGRLVQNILHEFGQLHGVIHSAGILRDSYILKKSEKEISEVLAPKVKGIYNADMATRDVALDFFIVCSSSAGITGNTGQADYAMANAYMDRYAGCRKSMVLDKQRSGKTLSVNWPLWKEGGMQVSEEIEKFLLESIGMVPLETLPGLTALYRAMHADTGQMMIMQGELAKLHATFLEDYSNEKIGNDRIPAPMGIEDSEKPREETQKGTYSQSEALTYFRKILSGAIQLPADQINVEKPMEEYGIDSVMVMQMTNVLEKVFGSLSKTLFFEYQNINELTGYFQTAFPERMNELLAVKDVASPSHAVVKNGHTLRHMDRFAVTPDHPRQGKTNVDGLDIAIIGLSGSYPQAKGIDAFWKILKEGRNCITEIPGDRWDHSQYFDKEKHRPGKTYGKWGGFLDGIDEFDPLFFNITPKEAGTMDPQERLFLQCVYEVMEDAGYTRETIGRHNGAGPGSNVGVYVGVMNDEYQLYGAQETALGRPLVLSGNSAAIANRVSYYFNFNGPSIALNTMCSSSLTTIHLACQSLRLGECEAAIAGGVNVNVHPNKYVALAYGKFLSSKGLCESFGAGGDGYVPGEGVGAVLLKPLSRALADNDHIYGVIKGTAVNHGGKTNGYTVPNPVAQANVIRKAMKMAGFDPGTISYLEAHGTGTSLGDPIEITGLNRAFDTGDRQYCAIGSVKTNIGHCESAAGIAGITKVLLQMKHRQLAPSLHAEDLNPNIDFKNSPFVVQQELAEWVRPVLTLDGGQREFPRRAGVSSFGAGGANAHVLIEEFIPERNSPSSDGQLPIQLPALIILSARDQVQLQQQAKELILWIAGSGQLPIQRLADLAYTLQIGREVMEERLAIEASSFLQLAERLGRFTAGEKIIDGVYTGRINERNEALDVIGMDEDMARTIDAWMDKQKYGKLLALWTKGLSFDWNKLYPEGNSETYRPQRISLPTYPFARKRCWFGPSAGDRGTGIHIDNAVDRSKGLLLTRAWNEVPGTAGGGTGKQVAILYSLETKEIANALKGNLSNSVLININDHAVFQPDQLRQNEWKGFDGWIDLAGCGSNPVESLEWIQWLQHLIEYGDKDGTRILCVTQGLSAFRNEKINLAGALHAGLYRMLGSEYSHLVSGHVDFETSTGINELADRISDEFSFGGEELEICYRDGKRYGSRLQEATTEGLSGERLHLSGDTVLWITGGTRGLGYLCALHFVKNYGVKRLVLTGQEQLPSRDEWDRYLQQDSLPAQRIRNILALEELGAEIKISAVPLIDQKALREELDNVKAVWGSIHGVIHCAGIGDRENPAFIRKSVEGIRKVLDPKVRSLGNLYECFKEEPLTFFILFSSVSAIIPSLAAGQAAYAMANAYMDHFAGARSGNCPLISIQWPNWKETGMGEIKTKAYQQSGLLGLTDAEGLRFLDLIIRERPGTVIMPALIDRDVWAPEQLLQHPKRKKRRLDNDEAVERTGEVAAAGVQGSLVDKTREWLTDLFAKELNLELAELKPDKPFPDYGIDSILITQLLQRIQKKLEQDVDPSALFEYSTIRSLADWLVEKFPDPLAKALFGTREEQVRIPMIEKMTASEKPGRQQAEKNVPGNVATDIAVIGMACRFPGAEDLDAYWNLLKEGRSAIRAVPRERWNSIHDYHAGLIDNPCYFDPKFFLLHENDVRAMDPQALVVLEESLKLFYHAGYATEEIKGKSIGVYLGGRSKHMPDPGQLSISRNPILTVGQNYLSANVSQFFDLRGPSIVMDTACSSALVAMNMAIQALQSKEIEAAVVGGVSLLNTEETLQLFQQRGILSSGPDFHIFDQRAGGIILGEGVGMVLLKTVDQALEAGDQIYATIKSIAINNDGRTAGPATPNIEAQKQVMQAALAKCGKNPEEVSYIEVNGSGSEVTDLIEMKAINAVYRPSGSLPCTLGSIKPNIGHPLCAEGIAGLIKVVEMLHNRQFVPFLSGNHPMKYFDISSSPFSFSRVVSEWPEAPKVAAINCFADGGTNAHVILAAWQPGDKEERPIRKPVPAPVLNRQDLRGDKVPVTPGEINGDISIWETFK